MGANRARVTKGQCVLQIQLSRKKFLQPSRKTRVVTSRNHYVICCNKSEKKSSILIFLRARIVPRFSFLKGAFLFKQFIDWGSARVMLCPLDNKVIKIKLYNAECRSIAFFTQKNTMIRPIHCASHELFNKQIVNHLQRCFVQFSAGTFQ